MRKIEYGHTHNSLLPNKSDDGCRQWRTPTFRSLSSSDEFCQSTSALWEAVWTISIHEMSQANLSQFCSSNFESSQLNSQSVRKLVPKSQLVSCCSILILKLLFIFIRFVAEQNVHHWCLICTLMKCKITFYYSSFSCWSGNMTCSNCAKCDSTAYSLHQIECYLTFPLQCILRLSRKYDS